MTDDSNPADPKELSIEYLDTSTEAHSHKIFAAIRQNPIFRFLSDKKGRDLSEREMLIVAGAVVSASDVEITRLENEAQRLRREASAVRAILGNPIWAPRQLVASSEAPLFETARQASVKSSSDAEYAFVKKYLTVGNVLGATVIIIGLLGGTVTYFTANFKDRAESAEKTSTYWKEQATGFETEAKNAKDAMKTSADNLAKSQEIIKELNHQLSQSQSLSASLNDQLKKAKIQGLEKASSK